MLFSQTASKGDCFEIITLQFNTDIEFEQQEQAMLSLNEVVSNFDGFKSRDYYYSNDSGHWVEFIVWSSESLAKQASEMVMKNEKALAVFGLVDQTTMSFSHYQHRGGVDN